jgi:hypothetical protein
MHVTIQLGAMVPHRLVQRMAKTRPAALKTLNEFYKKGCQEKKFSLDRKARFFLEIQPTEL